MTDQNVTQTGVYTYSALFEPAEEGGYVVTFPAIPNLATQGDTLEEARAMAEDCLQGYLEWRVEDGLPLPPSEDNTPGTIREPVIVTLSAAMAADELEAGEPDHRRGHEGVAGRQEPAS